MKCLKKNFEIFHLYFLYISINTKERLPFSFDNKYCRVPIWGAPFTVDVSKPKPNKPNTMNLVEKQA